MTAMTCTGTTQTGAPRVAYVEQGTLYLTTASGQVVESVKPQVPIADFAISPDASQVAFAVRGKRVYGGPIYLLNVRTGHLSELTASLHPVYQLAEGEQEVYDEPDFSPDGLQIVFDVHHENQGDGNDIVMASGPLAVLNLQTQRETILEATEHVSVGYAAFVNNPLWSPDGKRILVDFEVGAALVTADGTNLIDLSEQFVGGRENVLPYAFGWFGDGCVIYWLDKENQRGPNVSHLDVRVLHLKTKSTEPASRLLGIPSEILNAADGIEVSEDLLLIRSKNESLLFDLGTRKIIQHLPTSNARLVKGGRATPGQCD